MTGYWSFLAQKTIYETLAKNGITAKTILTKTLSDQEKKTLVKKVQEAYPFGVRENYPYQAWREQCDLILGYEFELKPITTKKVNKIKSKNKPKIQSIEVNPNQLNLFI